MNKLKSLWQDVRGAAVIEIAIALPMLILFIYGIFQVGIAFQASAGMQNALGEGARYATLFPVKTDEEIRQRIKDRVFGTGIGTFSEPSVTTPDASLCTKCRLLAVTFTMTPNFLFFTGPPVTLTREKRVYTAS